MCKADRKEALGACAVTMRGGGAHLLLLARGACSGDEPVNPHNTGRRDMQITTVYVPQASLDTHLSAITRERLTPGWPAR